MIDTIRTDLAKEKIMQFLESMHQLGYEKEQTLSLMRQAMEGEDTKL